MSTMILLLLIALGIREVLGVSTIEFFKDKNCGTSLGQVNGTTDGNCHKALGGDVGARLVSLDPNCAATIYTDIFCSDNGTIANLGSCLSSDAIIGSFSIDCQTADKPAVFTTANGPAAPTATATPSGFDQTTSKEANTQDAPATTINPALIGAIIAVSVMAILMIPITYFSWRCIQKRRDRRHVRLPDTKSPIYSPLPTISRQASLKGNVTIPRNTIKKTNPIFGIPRSNPSRNNSLPLNNIPRNNTPRKSLGRNSVPAATISRNTMHRRTVPQDGVQMPSEPFLALTGRSKEIPLVLDTSLEDDHFSLVSPLSPDTYRSQRNAGLDRSLPPTPPSLDRRPSSGALPWWQQPPTQRQRPQPGHTSYAELGGSRSSRALDPKNFL